MAHNDSYALGEDGFLNIAAPSGVLANDTDADGDLITARLVSGPAHGALSLNRDGTLAYTPDPDFHGTDTFTYRANDGTTDGNLATVSIIVDPVNDPPTANADAATTADNASVAVPVLANDTDLDGDSPTVTGLTQPSHGTAVVNADNTVTYTPAGNFAGTDTFTYTIGDGHGGSATGTVTIRILPRITIDDVTVTEGDAGTVFADFVIRLSNPSPDTVDVTGGTADDTATTPADYSAVVGSIGTFAPGVTAQTIRVIVNGDTLAEGDETFFVDLSDPSSAVITRGRGIGTILDDENSPPVGIDDAATTMPEDTPKAVAVLANDTDADGNPLTVTGVTQPSHGTAVVNADNTVTYTPAANYNGADSFTYTIGDGHGGTSTATVRLTVSAVNDAPVNTVPGPQSGFEDVPLPIAGLSIADVDAGDGPVRVMLSVGHGTLSVADSVAGGLPAAGISGNGTAAVVLSGTIDQINATLAAPGGLVYQGLLDFGGNDALTIATDDLGHTGAGGPQTDTDSVPIRIFSAAEQADRLGRQIDGLLADGTLNKGRANALKVKLDLKGNRGDVGKVDAFINQILAFLDAGILSAARARPLLDGARTLSVGVSTR